MSHAKYKKMPEVSEFHLAFSVSIPKSLVLHLDFYIPDRIRNIYKNVVSTYTFLSEENDEIEERFVYQCRLNGVELSDQENSKTVILKMKEFIDETFGWIHVKLSDVDSYSRILVDVYNKETGKSLAEHLLELGLVKKYVRPCHELNKDVDMNGIALRFP